MRINQWISHNTKYSRRQADELIKNNKVKIDSKIASLSDKVIKGQKIYVNNKRIFKLDSNKYLSLIHISEPTRPPVASRMPSSA